MIKASGSHALAWAALAASLSFGILRPSAKDAVNQFTLSCVIKNADENCTDLKNSNNEVSTL